MAQNECKLTGKIIDSSYHIPISLATVQIPDLKYNTLSDNNGIFTIDCLFADTISIEVSFIGYSNKKLRMPVNQWRDTLIIALDQQLINMEEVVITATRSERMLKDVPVLTQIITTTQMKASGATNVAEIINTIKPGVDFYNEGRGMTFRMQGVAAKYTLFLIDGEEQKLQLYKQPLEDTNGREANKLVRIYFEISKISLLGNSRLSKSLLKDLKGFWTISPLLLL